MSNLFSKVADYSMLVMGVPLAIVAGLILAPIIYAGHKYELYKDNKKMTGSRRKINEKDRSQRMLFPDIKLTSYATDSALGRECLERFFEREGYGIKNNPCFWISPTFKNQKSFINSRL